MNIKLHTENLPTSLLNSRYSYEEDLKIRIWKVTSTYFSFFSIFHLVRLILSDILKISLLACLILEIAMKKTLKLGFGRRPQDDSNCFSIFFLVMLILSCIPKISLLAWLIIEIAVKKTLKLWFGRRPDIFWRLFWDPLNHTYQC